MRYTVEAENRRGGEGRDLGAHKHAPRSTYRPLDVSPAQGRAVAEGQAVRKRAEAPRRSPRERSAERRTRAEHDRPRENHADRRIASEGEKDEEHHRDGASKPEEPSIRNDSQSYPTKPADQRRESSNPPSARALLRRRKGDRSIRPPVDGRMCHRWDPANPDTCQGPLEQLVLAGEDRRNRVVHEDVLDRLRKEAGDREDLDVRGAS